MIELPRRSFLRGLATILVAPSIISIQKTIEIIQPQELPRFIDDPWLAQHFPRRNLLFREDQYKDWLNLIYEGYAPRFVVGKDDEEKASSDPLALEFYRNFRT